MGKVYIGSIQEMQKIRNFTGFVKNPAMPRSGGRICRSGGIFRNN